MTAMIPYGRQEITQDDIDAVVKVLRSDFLTQGPVVPQFEAAVAKKVKARCAVSANSATSALHLACLALQLGKGDRLWTVPNTFVASANCGRYCDAEVDFVDIDPVSWNLSIPKLQDKLLLARKNSCLPKIVVPVHFAGQPVEQEAIWELSQEFGFKVLEDASHAIGATRHGESVGSCRWSHVTIFSFHPVKIMTSGEGGIAMTNDDAVADQMKLLRSHGITRESARFSRSGTHSEWYYEQQSLGYNYRMTDLQAALGLSQLSRVDSYVRRRNELARVYDVALADMPLQLPKVQAGNQSSFHLYVVRVHCDQDSAKQRVVYETLRRNGIGANVHYMPVHLQPYYRNLGFSDGQFPEAEKHGKSAITLPLYPGLTAEQQTSVINVLEAIM